MPTVQVLKKKLQVIRSTRKLTQAMKTASTVKYSKLNGLYSEYENYEKQCSKLYEAYRKDFNACFASADTSAPVCYIVIGSNKGMCGSFNTELINFFTDMLSKEEAEPVIFLCGRQVKEYFDNKRISYEKAYIFDDVPSYETAKELFSDVCCLMKEGRISGVKTVYPQYLNMMRQSPVCSDLMNFEERGEQEDTALFVPDRQTVIGGSAEKLLVSVLYKRILETALGAQAATLTTMRSAYDTACEYSTQLEAQINRKRQSQVTADVLETAAEYSMEREE